MREDEIKWMELLSEKEFQKLYLGEWVCQDCEYCLNGHKKFNGVCKKCGRKLTKTKER